MYPLNVFNLFPPFPRNNNVFVAMSFDKKFENRWENVIKPAINEVGLKPYRVDQKTISDSIITEIVSGIGNCRLFFADVTTLEHCGDRAFRNENVLYEVGIAHSRRLPEEVILFRSDNDHLMFDLANIRVNPYDPDEKPEEAKNLVSKALESARNEIVLQKHLSVQQTVDSLTYDCIQFILNKKFGYSIVNLIPEDVMIQGDTSGHLAKGQVILSTLLNLAIINIEYPENKSNLFKVETNGIRRREQYKYTGKTNYVITPFGEAVTEEIVSRLGLSHDPNTTYRGR
jgi:hypothetical protein